MSNKQTLMKFISEQGYKRNSPDKNNPFNIIPSGNITMKDVDHPVLGIDNLGNQQLMQPGLDYEYPGDTVFEIPIRQFGGDMKFWRPVLQQGGQKKIIYVDRDDPKGMARYQAYKDSTALYNSAIKAKKSFLKKYTTEYDLPVGDERSILEKLQGIGFKNKKEKKDYYKNTLNDAPKIWNDINKNKDLYNTKIVHDNMVSVSDLNALAKYPEDRQQYIHRIIKPMAIITGISDDFVKANATSKEAGWDPKIDYKRINQYFKDTGVDTRFKNQKEFENYKKYSTGVGNLDRLNPFRNDNDSIWSDIYQFYDYSNVKPNEIVIVKPKLPIPPKPDPIDIPERQKLEAIQLLTPQGIQQPEIQVDLPNIIPQARIPKYFNVVDKVNQPFGGTETEYRVYPDQDFPSMSTQTYPDGTPMNVRKAVPVYQYAGEKKPLYVESKNDPRYRAYQDSTSAYNKSIKLRNQAMLDIRNNLNEINSRRNMLTSLLGANPVTAVRTKSKDTWSSYPGGIKPVTSYSYFTSKDNLGDQWMLGGYDVLKKPEQQVVINNQKPQPDPIIARQKQNTLFELTSQGLIQRNANFNPNLEVRPQARIPQYFNVVDKVNQPFGGTETEYRVYPDQDFPSMSTQTYPDGTPMNVRKVVPVYQGGGSMLKAPSIVNYIEQEDINSESGDYNMNRALELGYTPDETGHWPSVDYETGEWLKSKSHPTRGMEIMAYTLNPELQRNLDLIENERGTLQYLPKKQRGGSEEYINITKEYNIPQFTKEYILKAIELDKKYPNAKFVCDANGCADIASRAASAMGYDFGKANAWDYGNRSDIVFTNPNYAKELENPSGPLHDPTSYDVSKEFLAMKNVLVGLNRKNNLLDVKGNNVKNNPNAQKIAAAKSRKEANDSFDYANQDIYEGSRGYEHVGYLLDNNKLLHGTAANKDHPAFFVIDDLADGINLSGYGKYEPVEAIAEPTFIQDFGNKIKSIFNRQEGGQNDFMNVKNWYNSYIQSPLFCIVASSPFNHPRILYKYGIYSK